MVPRFQFQLMLFFFPIFCVFTPVLFSKFQTLPLEIILALIKIMLTTIIIIHVISFELHDGKTAYAKTKKLINGAINANLISAFVLAS